VPPQLVHIPHNIRFSYVSGNAELRLGFMNRARALCNDELPFTSSTSFSAGEGSTRCNHSPCHQEWTARERTTLLAAEPENRLRDNTPREHGNMVGIATRGHPLSKWDHSHG